jgi:pimeloyl-ACP methyl ester carboxylesterase
MMRRLRAACILHTLGAQEGVMKTSHRGIQFISGKPIHQPVFLVAILLLGICTGCGSPEIAATTALPTTPTETATSLPGDTTAEIIPPRTVTPTVTRVALGNKVTFTTADGVQLAGTLFGAGEPAVILAHQGTTGANQTDWYAFAQVLEEHGYTALAFDFRGNGKSSGLPDRNKLDLDLAAALQFLRDQGHTRIVCMGASMGGTTCIRMALDGEKFEGLVALSSAMITSYGAGIRVSEEELASLTVPKLFITAENDSSLVINDITRMYESSPEPKALHLLPGSVHGTDLFDTDTRDELTRILMEFLENLPHP